MCSTPATTHSLSHRQLLCFYSNYSMVLLHSFIGQVYSIRHNHHVLPVFKSSAFQVSTNIPVPYSISFSSFQFCWRIKIFYPGSFKEPAFGVPTLRSRCGLLTVFLSNQYLAKCRHFIRMLTNVARLHVRDWGDGSVRNMLVLKAWKNEKAGHSDCPFLGKWR